MRHFIKLPVGSYNRWQITNMLSILVKTVFRYCRNFENLYCMQGISHSFPQPKMSLKCPFIMNSVPGKVEKENHIRKVWKSEERKVKNIGKLFTFLSFKL